jgi:hypothetical protein
MKIRLKSKFLYSTVNKDNMIEEHYCDTILNIGYKNSAYFLTIIKEYNYKVLIHADLVYYSKF